MTTFSDANGKEWNVPDLDVTLIRDVRNTSKVDLCDISGEVLTKVERDWVLLGEVLQVLCGQQNDIKGIRGEAIPRAYTALEGAVRDFFPPNQWSILQSALSQRQEIEKQIAELKPVLSVLNSPDLPTDIRDSIKAAIQELIQVSIGQRQSADQPSTSGQVATPSSVVSDLLGTLEQGRAA